MKNLIYEDQILNDIQDLEKTFKKTNQLFLTDEIKQHLFDFFNKYHITKTMTTKEKQDICNNKHDFLFNSFGPFWSVYNSYNKILLCNPRLCGTIFNEILKLVHEWEKKNPEKHIHKGTPYYFYGVSCILNEDIDKGLLLMHQAFQEDEQVIPSEKRLEPTPAMCLINLDNTNSKQFFKYKVDEIITFLEKYMGEYNRSGHNLNINILRTNFLKKLELREEIFFFIYCLFKLEKINKIDKSIKQNSLAIHINTNLIFEFCKLTEVLLKKKYSINQVKTKFMLDKRPDLIHYIDYFCQDPTINLNLRQNNINYLNKELDNNLTFQTTITNLANHSYSHIKFLTTPRPIEYDIALTYCLRNFGGHKIEYQDIINQDFDKIIQAILNVLFIIIEK